MCSECYELAGEEQRFRILQILQKQEARVSDLVEELAVTQPTVTHHLKLLQAAKLLVMDQRGREHWYRLNTASECFTNCGLLAGLIHAV